MDIRIAISPTGGESIGWVRVDVIVHVGKGFRKGPGLVFDLRRALACALWWGLTLALRRALACALWGGLTFASWGGMAFALWMGFAFACALLGAFALRRAMPFALLCAFALCRAMPFALLRAMAFALLRAFALGKAIPFAMLWAFALLWAFAFAVLRAFALPMVMGLCLPSVWHVVWVGALWPETESDSPAAQRPAVVELGVERRPWSGRCGRGPRANSCGSAARSGRVRRGTTTRVGALWPGTEGKLMRLSGPQWVGMEGNDDPGRGAVAGDRGRTPAAQRPAVGERWGGARPLRGGQAQLRCLGQRRDGLDPRRTSSPQGGGWK